MRSVLIRMMILSSFAAIIPAAQATIVINEIMQSNIDNLMIDKDFPDSWVELYNNGTDYVQINGYRLGDSSVADDAYKINQNFVIPPQGYLMIYCDKENTGFHTDFRVESSKGSLYLFDASNNIVDGISFKKMPAPNIAYGRTSDGGSKWAYFVTPTPGASNVGNTSSTLLPSPEFSKTGGLYSSSFTLKISAPASSTLPSDAVLCVTTDGREPTEKDAVTGTSTTMTVSSSVAVRAKYISSSQLSPRSTTNTYIFHPRTTSMPVFSIVTDPTYFYDTDIGIFVGEVDKNPNYEKDWRRPINVEYFDGDNNHKMLINQLAETRVMGGWSRRYAQKSLAIYANKRFGTKRFDTSTFWPDKPEVTLAKSFALRNSGNDFDGAYVRDALGQTIIGRASENVDWQAYRPAIIYINGVYKGIIDIRERSNEDYVYENYNELEDIDMIENWYDVKNGSLAPLDEFVTYYNSSLVSYQGLKERMDIDNFLDMFVAEMYCCNTDFPNNNIVCWKPWAEGGKWRWVIKDLDRFGMNWVSPTTDFIQFVRDFVKVGDWTGQRIKLFSLFFDIEELRELFIDRMAVYIGDMYQQSNVVATKNELVNLYKDEYMSHAGVYFSSAQNQYWSWNWNVNYIDEWASTRRTSIYENLRTTFGLSASYPLTIDTNGQKVTFNNITLTQPKFDGRYYTYRTAVLTVGQGYKLEADVINSNGTTTKRVSDGTVLTLSIASAKSVNVRVVEDTSGLGDVYADNNGINCVVNGQELTVECAEQLLNLTVYNLQGIAVASVSGGNTVYLPSNGIYVVKAVTPTTTHTAKITAK